MYVMRSATKIAGVPTANRAFTATASIVGAAAGAAAGAIAGPIGALAGTLLGAIAGAAAGCTIEETERHQQRREERLDRDIGVIGGDIGAPAIALAHPAGPRELASWFIVE